MSEQNWTVTSPQTIDVDGVTSLKAMDQKFSGFRPEYNRRDRFFARIICQV